MAMACMQPKPPNLCNSGSDRLNVEFRSTSRQQDNNPGDQESNIDIFVVPFFPSFLLSFFCFICVFVLQFHRYFPQKGPHTLQVYTMLSLACFSLFLITTASTAIFQTDNILLLDKPNQVYYKRQSSSFHPNITTCSGIGSTCEASCGTDYMLCGSQAEFLCYNPAAGDTCCAPGADNACKHYPRLPQQYCHLSTSLADAYFSLRRVMRRIILLPNLRLLLSQWP